MTYSQTACLFRKSWLQRSLHMKLLRDCSGHSHTAFCTTQYQPVWPLSQVSVLEIRMCGKHRVFCVSYKVQRWLSLSKATCWLKSCDFQSLSLSAFLQEGWKDAQANPVTTFSWWDLIFQYSLLHSNCQKTERDTSSSSSEPSALHCDSQPF